MKLPSEGRSSAKVSPLSLLKQPSPLMQPQCVTPRLSGKNSSSASVSPIQNPVKVAKGDTSEAQTNNEDNDNGVSFALPESTAQADTVAEHNETHQSGRSRRRAAKKEEKKAKAAAAAMGKNDSVSSSSAAMTSEALGLTAIFSRVELSFGFSTSRSSTSHSNTAMLYPRDIANLLLWSVPCAVPLIEAPRFVFVKNRSRVRNVVMIYVNGWSYDMLMCTGAGLPRPTSQPAPSTVNDDNSADNATIASEGAQPWNERICAALLGPVRCGQCWARGALGNLNVATHSSTSNSSSSTGVQYAPVLLPSTKNTLEQDIFWRTDRPRVPNSRSTANAKLSVVKQGSGTDATYPVPAETTVRGAGALFKRARAIVEGQSGPTEGDNTSAEEITTTKNAVTPESTSVTTQEEEDWVRLWQDRTSLMAHALHISQHAEVLQALGFTLQAPNNNSNEWRRFVEKLPDKDGTTSSECPAVPKVYAFDCEMVLVEGQVSVLARATLVDVVTRRVVLDWLVKPREPVVDYLTRYSGVDEAMLASVTTTLSDVQDALLKYIDSNNTIVVGHSLENDFEACKLIPNCYLLDTAWLYPHPAGLPYKNSLRFLAMRYLNRRIQDGSHDSCVDALTSAELAFLKLLHGPTFGIQESVSVLGLMTEAASATLHVRLRLFDEPTTLQSMLPNNKKAAKPPAQSDTSPATDTSNDSSSNVTDGKTSFFLDAVPVRHDEDATRKVVRSLLLSREQQQEKTKSDPQASTAGEEKKGSGEADVYSFTWVQLRETTVDVVQHSVKPHADDANVDEDTGKDVKDGDDAASYEAKQLAAVEATNRRVLRIVEACADDTIIVLVAAVCKGQAGGNHFSRAQGACFAWVKDATAPGPAEDYLHPVTQSNSAGAGRHAATIDTPPACNTQ